MLQAVPGGRVIQAVQGARVCATTSRAMWPSDTSNFVMHLSCYYKSCLSTSCATTVWRVPACFGYDVCCCSCPPQQGGVEISFVRSFTFASFTFCTPSVGPSFFARVFLWVSCFGFVSSFVGPSRHTRRSSFVVLRSLHARHSLRSAHGDQLAHVSSSW